MGGSAAADSGAAAASEVAVARPASASEVVDWNELVAANPGGGEVWAGAREHGGFIVRVRVPVAAAAVAAPAFIPQTSSASSQETTPAMTASNETSPA